MTRKISDPRPAPAARFHTVFANGVWTILDRHQYSHGRALNTWKQADSICRDLNAEKVAR